MRKLGYKGADSPDHRDFAILRLGVTTTPEAASLEDKVSMVLDQSLLSSCVSHAIAQALMVRGKPHTSILFNYYNARKQHGDEHVDGGTFIRLALKGANKFGLPENQAWPYELGRWPERPPLDSYRVGSDEKLISYYRIAGDGATRTEGVKRAIAEGLPVVFGTDVDESFLNHKGAGLVDIPSGNIVGGHAMCIVGYDAEGIRVVNSWGRGWGDHGFVNLTWGYLEWYATRDIWALQA